MRTLMTLLMLTVTAGGCSAPKKPDAKIASSASAADRLPPIESSYRRNGRGVPYGRSDSNEAYVTAKLPISRSPGYGFSKENPVKLGPWSDDLLHIRYLNSLRGPSGEPIEYERKGACCPFETEHSPFGGMLDIYRLRIEGSASEMYLFVDMYDSDTPQIPIGLTQRN